MPEGMISIIAVLLPLGEFCRLEKGGILYGLVKLKFSHDVTKIQTTKLFILLIFYFNDI